MFAITSKTIVFTPGEGVHTIEEMHCRPGAFRYGNRVLHQSNGLAVLADHTYGLQRLAVVPCALIPEGWAHAYLEQWELDHSVQIRQELMYGQQALEMAGYHVKHALAELARDANSGRGCITRLVTTPGSDGRAFIFGPVSEIEALRRAVVAHMWTQAQDTRERAELETLAGRMADNAETLDEVVRFAAVCVALDKDVDAIFKPLAASGVLIEGDDIAELKQRAQYVARAQLNYLRK